MPQDHAGNLATRVSPSFEEFMELRDGYGAVMVSAEISSDVHTPVSAFIKLDRGGPGFLLESADSTKMWGRYSFLGIGMKALAFTRDGSLIVREEGVERSLTGDPVRALVDLVDGARVRVPDDMPFAGGAVGYLGYDVFKYFENVPVSGHPMALPEMMFMFPRRLIAFDHLRSRMRLSVLVSVPRGREACALTHARAVAELEEMMASLNVPLHGGAALDLAPAAGPRVPQDDPWMANTAESEGSSERPCTPRANMSAERFELMASRAREYIAAGDAFQVVVSARFSVPFGGDPLRMYRYLRAENPSPYMFFMRFGGMTLVGSSPEPMVTRRGDRVLIRPIAGTRARGATAAEDAELSRELLADPKERAEHVMLVDLARNDLGRVCTPGSISVTRLMDVENYSHVMHIVSEVEGMLHPGLGNHDLLRATFPAGTVSGAPKVRAGEIIEELESEGRGPYAGAIGYLGYSGDMDTCIAIRTAVVAGGRAFVQAGAGIVADSVPSSERREVLNKASAVLRAVEAAGVSERHRSTGHGFGLSETPVWDVEMEGVGQ